MSLLELLFSVVVGIFNVYYVLIRTNTVGVEDDLMADYETQDYA